VKIDRAIADGSFFRNGAFLWAIRAARDRGTALHLMGIVSFFSSHGSINHLFALMELARREGVGDLFIHAMLGRRGEMPESGAHYVGSIEKARDIGLGNRSDIGRYWSMDGVGTDRFYHLLVTRGTPVGAPESLKAQGIAGGTY
jgi:2,3-bisphosphoglycerate-independent phosphoglycerate mutase